MLCRQTLFYVQENAKLPEVIYGVAVPLFSMAISLAWASAARNPVIHGYHLRLSGVPGESRVSLTSAGDGEGLAGGPWNCMVRA